MNKTIHTFVLTLASALRAGADVIEHCLSDAPASPEAASVPATSAAEPAATAPAKRGRPKKEAAPEPEPTPEPVTEQEPEVITYKQEGTTGLPTITNWEDLKKLCKPLIEASGPALAKLKETIKAHGGSKLADLPVENYPAFIQEVQAQLADLPKAGEEV
jgi:hypothetical protein